VANFLIRLIDENQPLWAVGSPSPTSYPQAAVNTVDSTASLLVASEKPLVHCIDCTVRPPIFAVVDWSVKLQASLFRS
jgi:hypothetical protein